MEYCGIIEGPGGPVVKWFKTEEDATQWFIEFRKALPRCELRYTIAKNLFSISG